MPAQRPVRLRPPRGSPRRWEPDCIQISACDKPPRSSGAWPPPRRSWAGSAPEGDVEPARPRRIVSCGQKGRGARRAERACRFAPAPRWRRARQCGACRFADDHRNRALCLTVGRLGGRCLSRSAAPRLLGDAKAGVAARYRPGAGASGCVSRRWSLNERPLRAEWARTSRPRTRTRKRPMARGSSIRMSADRRAR